MSTQTRPRRRAAAKRTDNPFPYGWREIPKQLPNGDWDYDQIPLTLEDALHPQFGDVMPQSTPHETDTSYLARVAERRLASDPQALVGHDLQIIWEKSVGLRPHSPDISIIFGVRDAKTRIWTSFDVAKEGVRPRMMIEVVSPAYRDNDIVTKVFHYHRARVPFYYIVDREVDKGPVSLIGYQYRQAAYRQLSLAPNGWLWVEPLALWMATKDNRVVCYDGATKEEIGDYTAVVAKLESANLALAEAERRAEQLAAENEHMKARLRELENGARKSRNGKRKT